MRVGFFLPLLVGLVSGLPLGSIRAQQNTVAIPVVGSPSVDSAQSPQPRAVTPMEAAPAGDAAPAGVEVVDPDEIKATALAREVLALLPGDRHYRELAARVIAHTYRERGFRPLWDASQLTASFHRSLATALADHAMPELLALDPDDLFARIPGETVDKRDLAHTIALVDAALLVRLGYVPVEKIWSEWNKEDAPGKNEVTPEALAGKLVAVTHLQPFSVETALTNLGPQNWVYRELRKAYPAAKSAILQYSGLPNIPDPTTTGVGRPGEFFPAAPAVAAHLVDRGYLRMAPDALPSLNMMTQELTAALIAFQMDHGLDPDGIFGPSSWRYLNTNAADRFRSLTINLHRARLLPDKMGGRYTIANVPTAEVYCFDENDFHTLSMRVVVGKAGKKSHETVIFRDILQEIEFAPFWNVPRSIAVSELIPKIREDWSYLSRNNYEIVSATNPGNGQSYSIDDATLDQVARGSLIIRQKPGDDNALGNVKYLFPNRYNIYMHDTPAKSFFSRSQRDFSHGCIRLEDPEGFGAWVLGPEGWDRDKVGSAMNGGRRRNLAVKNKVNIYITYFTTYPRPIPGGRYVMTPAPDLYQRDSADAKTLQAVIPWNEP